MAEASEPMRFRAHLAGAAALLALAIWLASGTMTPYASTYVYSTATEPCGYLVNVDQPHHEAVFQMLDGQPRARWERSVVLRRLLFPLCAFPFMKAFGYLPGGFFASLLCQLGGLLALALHLRRRHGEAAAIAGSWLLAVYPGITYWAGLPYAYVAIVPASIALFILLVRLDERRGWAPVAAIGAAMGLLFTAYDLAPFFGVAAVLLLLARRRFAELPVAVATMAAAPLASLLALKLVFHAPLANPNTAIYGAVFRAYLHPPGLGAWLGTIADFPVVLGWNFLCSNMLFLPACFLLIAGLGKRRLAPTEAALGAAVALVFLFNNLAPPYAGRWQMRGFFIARLYQPLFVALLVYCARVLGDWRSLPPARARLLWATALFMFVGNATIAFGPIARIPWAGSVYHFFYRHSPATTMDDNLARHGRRPLGFCDRGPRPTVNRP
jgi:hypothetical protein